ncbi:MAG: FtsX-like permease family protein [Acidobacteria bacterium]|nr:FtsX-like permease family protein [Acidobacteriota bacterium]
MTQLFRQVIVRRLATERLRTMVTAVGVAVGIAVVLAIRLTNASALRGFDAALDMTSGRTGLEILGVGGTLDERLIADLDWLRVYGHASPVIDADLVVRTSAFAQRATVDKGDEPTELLRVYGVDVLRDAPLRTYATADAARGTTDILRLLVEPGAIVVTRAFADRHGVTVGDRLVGLVDDRQVSLTVLGLLAADGPAALLDGHFALMDLAAAQDAFGRAGRIDRIDIRLRDGVDVAEAEAAVRARLPDGVNVQRPSRRSAQVERMLAAFHMNLTALSSIALLVGLFLVYNAVSVSVLARRHEIGTLRALGGTSRQVQALFLGEALVFGALGVAAGVPLGRALASAMGSLTSATVATLYVRSAAATPELSGWDVLLAAVIGLPLSLAAAWLPAREAARVPPTAVMRGADRVTARLRNGGVMPAVGVGLIVLAAGLARVPAVDGLPLAGYAAAAALVFGAALLTPPVLRGAARVGRTASFRLLRVGGWLAHANLGGHVSRVAVSVAALATSLAMTVAITVMVGSFRETVIEWVGQTLRADLYVGPATRASGARAVAISQTVEAVVRAHPDVLAVDAFRNLSVTYDDTPITLVAGDVDTLLSHGGLRVKAPVDGRAALQALAGRDVVAVSEPFAMRHDLRVGDRVTLPTPQGPRTFDVAAVFYDYSNDRGVVRMDIAVFTRHFGDRRPAGLAVYLREGADAVAVRDALLRDIEGTAGVFIHSNRALRQEVLRIFDSTFAVTYALQAIAVLVALLGIIGTLMTLVIERRREIAILRALGTSRRQLTTMIVGEAAMLGAIAQGMGLGVGLLLSLILVYTVLVQSFGWTIQWYVPWRALARMSAFVVIATLVAGLYPAWRAMRDVSVVPERDE